MKFPVRSFSSFFSPAQNTSKNSLDYIRLSKALKLSPKHRRTHTHTRASVRLLLTSLTEWGKALVRVGEIQYKSWRGDGKPIWKNNMKIRFTPCPNGGGISSELTFKPNTHITRKRQRNEFPPGGCFSPSVPKTMPERWKAWQKPQLAREGRRRGWWPSFRNNFNFE